jgi:hypothetical protein
MRPAGSAVWARAAATEQSKNTTISPETIAQRGVRCSFKVMSSLRYGRRLLQLIRRIIRDFDLTNKAFAIAPQACKQNTSPRLMVGSSALRRNLLPDRCLAPVDYNFADFGWKIKRRVDVESAGTVATARKKTHQFLKNLLR